MQSVMFSKGLQHLPIDQASEKIANLGFEGVDLTVRPGGHVEPDQVKDRLPEALKAINKSGLVLSMLTTDIKHPDDAAAGPIFQSAAECGVKFLKLGYIPYTYGSYRENLAMMKRDAVGFEALAKEYGVCCCHHIHSANWMTCSPIALDAILADVDPDLVGAYIDPCHMVIEGGLAGWMMGLDALKGKIRLVAVKDFRWPGEPARPDEGFQYPRFVPLRDGTVPWYQVMRILVDQGYDGVISFHMEYTDLTKEQELQAVADDKKYFDEIMERIRCRIPGI